MNIFNDARVTRGLPSLVSLLGAATFATSLPAWGSDLSDLTLPHDGRSRRSTSTMRIGEVRRGGAERKINAKADPRGDREDDYASVAFWYQTGTPTLDARATTDRECRLPSLERVTAYARDFTDRQYHGEGKAETQQLSPSAGPQLFSRASSASNSWLEIRFEVKKKEPLRLLINASKADDYGKYQASLNGVKLHAPLDFYGEKFVDQEFHLLDFWPEPGQYTLRLDAVGKNPRSSG